MKVVVTGGSGFIGSYVVMEALKSGARVVVVDTVAPPAEVRAAGAVEWQESDCADVEKMRAVFQGAGVVYHFASMTNPATTWQNPAEEFNATIGLSARIFDLCGSCGVRKVVYPSSGGTVYGASSTPWTEDQLPAPANPHGIAKLATEHFLAYYARLHAYQYDIYRIGNPYGPRQRGSGRQGVVAVWMTQILRGQPVVVYGDESVLRDYIFVEDAAALMAHSLHDVTSSGVFNVGSGRGTSIRELFELVRRIVDLPVHGEFTHSRAFDNRSIVLNPDKLHALKPSVRLRSLEEGLRVTWAWYRNNLMQA
jgi:UDP-glucose 4-epimerase